jgi:alkyl sulfatase BDS1-like metallo-beta-lactamase superfamily hydrolase
MAARDGVRIVAPKGFMHETTSENILAGPAMGRRAVYMYGGGLARSPRGHVGTGLGKSPSAGSSCFSLLDDPERVFDIVTP